VALNGKDIAALKAYAADEYKLINGCLRGDTPCDARILAMIASIDRAIAASGLPSDRILYRGVGGDAARTIRTSGIGIGSTFSDAAFMSTSTDPLAAGMFTPPPPGGLMLRIRASAGTPALDMAAYSLYPNEREFLLPRNCLLRVLGYKSRASELDTEVVIDG
jgi:hypothetical protein